MSNPLIEHVRAEYAAALNLMVDKNHDYAGNEDPLANFRLAEQLGVCPTPEAIFTRLLDKVARIARGLKGDFSVRGENMRDSARDLSNYVHILTFALENPAVPADPNVLLGAAQYAPANTHQERSRT